MIFSAIDDNIKQASELLLRGEVIVYPTDTLYGIGVDATNTEAINKLNKLKKRKSPLSIIVSSIKMLKKYAKISKNDLKYLNKFLPGKFTFLLSKKESNLSKIITLNTKKVGIRIPDSDFIINVVNYINRPIITTSVNFHGEKPINDIKEIYNLFKGIYIFTDDIINESKGSTIVDLNGENSQIIRKGDGIFYL